MDVVYLCEEEVCEVQEVFSRPAHARIGWSVRQKRLLLKVEKSSYSPLGAIHWPAIQRWINLQIRFFDAWGRLIRQKKLARNDLESLV